MSGRTVVIYVRIFFEHTRGIPQPRCTAAAAATAAYISAHNWSRRSPRKLRTCAERIPAKLERKPTTAAAHAAHAAHATYAAKR